MEYPTRLVQEDIYCPWDIHTSTSWVSKDHPSHTQSMGHPTGLIQKDINCPWDICTPTSWMSLDHPSHTQIYGISHQTGARGYKLSLGHSHIYQLNVPGSSILHSIYGTSHWSDTRVHKLSLGHSQTHRLNVPGSSIPHSNLWDIPPDWGPGDINCPQDIKHHQLIVPGSSIPDQKIYGISHWTSTRQHQSILRTVRHPKHLDWMLQGQLLDNIM
jgi:hypothetical protein